MAAARERRPNNALAVDADAARIESTVRHSADRRLAGLRRIVATLQANQHARERIFTDAPNRIIDRTRHHGVQVVTNDRVEIGIVWSCRTTASSTLTAPLSASRTATTSGSRSTAATCVTLIQQFITAERLSCRIPRPRDLSIAVRVEHLTAPIDSGLLGFAF